MRLRTKIIFLITASLAGLGLLSSLLVYNIMLDVLKKDLLEKGVTVARSLAKGITRDVIGNETVLVHEYLRSMVAETPDLEYVFVIGFKNELFAHSFEGSFPPDLHVQKNNAESPIRYLDTEKGPVMEIWAPLIKDLTAHVHIGLNESGLYAHAKALRNRMLLLTLGMVLITVLISAIVSQRITRPLGRLVDSMRDYGREGTTGRLEISSGGKEVEELTVTFQEMIQKLEQSSKALQKSEKKFRDIVESTSDWIWEVDKNGVYTYASPNVTKLLGYEPKDIIGKTVFDLMPPDEAKRVGEIFTDIANSKKPIVVLENTNIHEDGHHVVLETSGEPILDENGNLIGYRGVDRDITERKQAEEALRQYERIISATDDHMSFLDRNYIYQAVNNAYLQAHHKTREEIVGHSVADLLGEDLFERLVKKNLDRCLAGEEIHYQAWFDFHELGRRYMEVAYYVYAETDGAIVGVVVNARDITERQQAEEQIKASLAEKVTLLKEVHHRVKNNMQIITSLLRLQSDTLKDDRDLDMFRESQMRIQAMALIHDKLYRSDDLAGIGFDEYLKELSTHLVRTYSINPGAVTVQVEAADVRLGLDTAIPCGLLANELVSNSLKHAFPDDRKGEIALTLQPVEDDQIALTISDNGIGLPADLDIRNTKSLGMELIFLLAEGQLGGSVEVDRTDGTAFRVVFRNG